MKSVNGTELKEEVVFRFSGAQEDRPKVGAKVKYIGYEGGGFDGIVPGSFKYTGPFSGVGYGFSTYFRIYKNELKPEKK